MSTGSSGKRQLKASAATTTSSSTTSLERKLRLVRESMSPTKRTNEWLKNTETPGGKAIVSNVFDAKDSKTAKSSHKLGVKGSKISKPAVSQVSSSCSDGSGRGGSSKGITSKSRRKGWLSLLWSFVCSKKNDVKTGDNLDLEGATVIGENTPAKSPLFDQTLVKENSPASFLALEGNTTLIDDDNSTLSEDDILDRKEAQANVEELYRGWTEDEIWLFEKLDWRGYEPLLPKRWAGDFLTMYDLLFTDDDSVAFIKSACGKDYHGKPVLFLLN